MYQIMKMNYLWSFSFLKYEEIWKTAAENAILVPRIVKYADLLALSLLYATVTHVIPQPPIIKFVIWKIICGPLQISRPHIDIKPHPKCKS